MNKVKTFKEFVESVNNYPQTLEENIEFYRKRLIETDIPDEQVMSRFYSYPTNTCQPMLVEKMTIDRLVKKHGEKGYIIISACRSNLDKKTNDENTKNLIKDIKSSSYRHLPVYGGYRDLSMGEESNFEPSFIVFNRNTNGDEQSWENLKSFGLEMCKKYNQSSVLVKNPGEPPIWLDGDGNKKSKNETELVMKNDSEQEFFTSFISLETVKELKTRYLWQQFVRICKQKGLKEFDTDEFKQYRKKHIKDAPVYKRVTFDIKPLDENEVIEGVYVNPSPCDRNEWIGRQKSGEILVMLELFED